MKRERYHYFVEGEDDRKVSVTMDVEDFAKIQSYLDKNKTQYKISGGI